MSKLRTALSILLIATGLAAAPMAPASAQDAENAPIVDVITGQLNALAINDSAKAYSYAAPTIQQKFGDADTFMRMVRQGYGALISPSGIDFQRFEQRDGRAVQSVKILARDGTAWMARYMMERMDDGTWRIAGCQMHQLPAESV